MNELIVVKQLPIIEEHLRQLGAQIDQRVAVAAALVCTEETVKEVKNVRSTLNAQFNELEAQRKAVKEAVLDPYNAFEKVYKDYVSSKFKSADADLKCKIGEVEDGLKSEKAGEVLGYFAEYATSLGLDWLRFEDAGLNITLSASLKSLKAQAKAYADQVRGDLALIDTQEYRDEILVEYKQCHDVSRAVTAVVERHKAIEQQKEIDAERAEQAKQVQEVVAKVEAAMPPKEVEREITYECKFTVHATKTQLSTLKEFMKKEGILYE